MLNLAADFMAGYVNIRLLLIRSRSAVRCQNLISTTPQITANLERLGRNREASLSLVRGEGGRLSFAMNVCERFYDEEWSI